MRYNQRPKAGEVVKPAVDKLEYRTITLGNGLKAALVSDAEADKAAAALDVSYADLLQT